LVVVVAVAGCGARTALRVGPRPDAGLPDVPRPADAQPAPDAPSELVVSCPAPIRGHQGDVVPVTASALSHAGLALRYQWTVVSRPPGSSAQPTAPSALSTRFALDAGGEWALQFAARDSAGATQSCTVTVDADPAIDLECPDDQSGYQGATLPLVASARSTLGRPIRVHWSVLASPAGSASVPSPIDSTNATFLLDALGDWRLELTATDSQGLSASCVTNLRADPDVVVTCPPDVRSAPFVTAHLTATAISRRGLVLSYRWEIVARPLTSTASLSAPAALSTAFTFDVAGDWTYRFTATNPRGNSASCTTRATAVSDEAVRVELVWNVDRACVGCNAQGGDQDLDLHLADVATAMGHWSVFAPDDADCYYENCVPGRVISTPDWSPPGPVNNPQLDIDHIVDLPGPENINVQQGMAGAQFDVGVHFYGAHGHSTTSATVVRVYCNGAMVFQSEPVQLSQGTDSDFVPDDHNLWHVGRITATAGGCAFARCGAPGALGSCIRPLRAW
jgi:hypothetical protein